jgi:hypothetical protein
VPTGYKRILFEDIYGYKNNLYAVGIAEKEDGDYTGVIVHYNGNKWEVINTPQIKEYFVNIKFLENGDVLIYSQNYLEPHEPSRLYKYKNGNLTLLRKSSLGIFCEILNNKLYVSTDNKVYEYKDGSLIETLNLSGTGYVGGLWGRTIKDFFCTKEGWNLGHYNGSDLVNIYHIEGYIDNIQMFDKELFVVCYVGSGLNYVLHGKLN